MEQIDEIRGKREILLTVRIRFAPEMQPVKEATLDRVIENTLYACDISKAGLTVDQIQDAFSLESGGYSLNQGDLRATLLRLVKSHRIVRAQNATDKYHLSDKARDEIITVQKEAERNYSRIISRVFENVTDNPSIYREPLLRTLSSIFAQLGEENVKLIKGLAETNGFYAGYVNAALNEVKSDFPSINLEILEAAIVRFIRDKDPDYDELKWNIAQNYYLTKALGLDPTGSVLSEEIFENSKFYLDTNVLIVALEPEDDRHTSFLEFANACKQLGILLVVCPPTLHELDNWVTYQFELISKVVNQIPPATAPKVRSLFYQIYLRRIETGGNTDLKDLFSSFNSPRKDLEATYNVVFEDDSWFDNALNDSDISRISEHIKNRFFDLRKRRKNRNAALHDAVLLSWVEKKKEESKHKVRLVTTDATLPRLSLAEFDTTSLAITLDALLQWLSPLSPDQSEHKFSTVFSDMIRSRLLPQDRFFRLEDFEIFNSMHMSTKDLPAKDVEGCISYIKSNALSLDPSNPVDREKLSYEVSKYFADPTREYKQELANLENQNSELTKRYESKLGDSIRQSDELKKDYENQITELTARVSEIEQTNQENKVKMQTNNRFQFCALTFILVEVVIFLVVQQYGDGANWLQKLINSWVLFVSPVPIAILVGRVLIGKEGLKYLNWPFTLFLKDEN